MQALIEADPGLEWGGRQLDGRMGFSAAASNQLPDWLWARGMGWRFPDGILPISSYLHNFANPTFLLILSIWDIQKKVFDLNPELEVQRLAF